MPSMNYHLFLLLLFTFRASNSVRLVFDVENAFWSQKSIKLKAQDAYGHLLGEDEEVKYQNKLSWVVAMDRYRKTLRCLCQVTLLEESGDEETYLGAFEAFNAAWLKDSFSRLPVSENITVLWYVFEKGAVTKLDPEMGGEIQSHRWLQIKYVVVSEFDEEVELSALDKHDSIVKQEIVDKGKTLRWNHFVTSKTRHFRYKCRASRVIEASVEEIGTAEIFKSDSISYEYLDEVGTLEQWWAVNNSGIRKYNIITGKYSKQKISWAPLD